VARETDVEDLRAYLSDLQGWTREGRMAGLTGDALTASVLPRMKARYGGWTAFDYFAPREIGFMDAELAGTKRVPQPAKE
jgi:hypothetical protein